MLDAVTAGDSMDVTENYLDRKTICWLNIGRESDDAEARGSTLQYVVVVGILSVSFPTKTSLLRTLSLHSNNVRPKSLQLIS